MIRLSVTISLFVLELLLSGCSTQPSSHPLNTARTPIPTDAKALDTCSSLGTMACSLMSVVTGDYGVERRSACIAYIERGGTRVETCGSVPASQP